MHKRRNHITNTVKILKFSKQQQNQTTHALCILYNNLIQLSLVAIYTALT